MCESGLRGVPDYSLATGLSGCGAAHPRLLPLAPGAANRPTWNLLARPEMTCSQEGSGQQLRGVAVVSVRP